MVKDVFLHGIGDIITSVVAAYLFDFESLLGEVYGRQVSFEGLNLHYSIHTLVPQTAFY